MPLPLSETISATVSPCAWVQGSLSLNGRKRQSMEAQLGLRNAELQKARRAAQQAGAGAGAR
jgi:hypothetical protein